MSFDRTEINELLADIRQATEQARETGAQVSAERDRLAQESREQDDERADAARDGEYGRDWQQLQGQIDRGETTLARVLTGADDSALAQRIRAVAAENLQTVTDEIGEHDVATGGERFSGLNEAFAGLRDSMERAAEAAERARGQQ